MKISARRLILCFYAISFHIMVVHVRCDWLIKCGDCKCKWNSGKKTADCKNITLSIIPQYLSSELQVIDLSYNQITIIDEAAFLKADLQNLHKLFMKNCSLEIIHPNGLDGLEILIELDLSNNVIKTLPKDVFISLVKLRSVILNNNQIETLENGLFRNLKYLHKIELKNNRISLVEYDVFINLPFLSQIFLNGNKLNILRKETFEKLKRLASLSLELNPWNCTCELQSFRDYALKRNLYTPPTSCYYPPQLRGMLWTDNQPEAFACKPKIIYPSRGASINTSKENVTLICRVYASPNTLIAWDYNKQIYSSNYQSRVNIQLLREENTPDNEFGRDIFISRLTIIGAEKSDEGTYTCYAENAGGKDEVQMSLLVQKHNHQNLLLQNNLIIIICLMVLGLLSASIFLAMITCCIYKRFKAINAGQTVDHNNHHSHQKRQFNGLNVVNSVNDTYHQQNGETNYVEIKQTKVSTGNLAVGSINNFTDLKDARGFFRDSNNQGAVTQQHAEPNCSTLPGRHKQDNTGEYQPDLLPYIPQSISFNNSSLYSYTVNQPTSYDNQQQLQHQQQLLQQQKQKQKLQQQQQELEQQHQFDQQQQQTYTQQHPHHQLEDQIDDLRYGNNFRRSKYVTTAPHQQFQRQHEQQHQQQQQHKQQHAEYLHYGIMGLPTGKMAATTTTTNAAASMAPPGIGSAGMGILPPLRRGYIGESSSDLDDAHNLPRQSIVRTSPSLNFLSNYYQRRELL